MTIFDTWEWPQYVLALWWSGWLTVAIIVWIITGRHAVSHWASVACLNIILYFGGFWT